MASPDTGKRLAQVQLLMGIVGSPIAAAVAPLTAQAKIPLVITNAMKHFNLSEWLIRHRSLVTYFMLVIFIAGIGSYFRLGPCS